MKINNKCYEQIGLIFDVPIVWYAQRRYKVLTAKQARTLAQKSNHKSIFDQFNKIDKMIEAAANNGEYMLILNEYIFPKVEEELHMNGYTTGYDNVTHNYIIYWGDNDAENT